MKAVAVVSGMILSAGWSGVFAACPNGASGYLDIAQIASTFGGQVVCAQRSGTTDASNRWSEVHNTPVTGTNNLDEYARGPNDAVDPRRNGIGTWRTLDIANNDQRISYDYNGDPGGPYNYLVHDNGSGSYSFCTARGTTPVADATLATPAGDNPCGW
jgi:hypothetical protein